MLTDAIMAQITKRHQGPSMTRARFDEGFQCLHEVLTPFVNSAGWLHYVEKPEQPVKAPILIAHKALLRACTKICPNLAFTKSVVTQVFQQLLKEKAWGMGRHRASRACLLNIQLCMEMLCEIMFQC